MNRNAPPILAGRTVGTARPGTPSPQAARLDAGGPTRLHQASAYAAAAAEATAGGLSIASVAAASAFTPLAATAGGLWFAGAALAEGANNPRDNVASAANAINAVAGATQLATAFLSGSPQSSVAITSAVTWGVNAATNIGKAIANAGANTTSRLAQGAGGVLNFGAAVAAGATIGASANGDSVTARRLSVASGALWIGGAVAQGAAARWAGKPQSVANHARDLEANHPASRGS
jgi:hypothetical protein